MKIKITILSLLIGISMGYAQKSDSLLITKNTANRLIESDRKLTIGGYAQIDYNQEFGASEMKNGTLDVHRLVMLLGYNFNDRVQFVSEIEYEHVKEVYVEQAFLQYKVNSFINLRAGLMLIPMGLINEYHEPPVFNGVERPLTDKYIAPTTWRELGFGLSGNIIKASLKYQAYVVNGFNGYDGSAHFSGKNGLRKGRQKGAESYISSPNFTGKVEYYGIRGLNLGLSGYFGKSQSTLFNNLDKNDNQAIATADSSVIGINMLGVDARYNFKGLQMRGQLYYSSFNNTDQYNQFTGSDMGSSMIGYYIEAGYNVFRPFNKIKSELIPFIRYEAYNTQNSMAGNLHSNPSYDNSNITIGMGWKITPQVVIKSDLQFYNSADKSSIKMFNAGVGVMF